ncbi:transmembrane protein [Mycolicibacterium canariasense]|uniref:Transmembrane protein n=1 Tax=Mycolicibacterium canariasense TaxID=228230 RepID=A0A117IC26_MYCCR|nr:hypothetical protein [Mycolicibacterium canariasense]MCV7213154.1 hypothetical protein [Mycolicibacterium canariasense]GAS98884.1 transmembrane protein [Mycolicibacterium canariasense]
MRVSADVERCPTCHQPLPGPDVYVEDPPSRLIVWIVGAMIVWGLIAAAVWLVVF